MNDKGANSLHQNHLSVVTKKQPCTEFPLVNFLLQERKEGKGGYYGNRETTGIDATDKPEIFDQYLKQVMPYLHTDDSPKGTDRYGIPDSYQIKTKSIGSALAEHAYIGDMDNEPARRRLLHLDMFHKIALRGFVQTYNQNLNTIVYGTGYNKLNKKLSDALGLEVVTTAAENHQDHPFHIDHYRKNDSTNNIQEYLGEIAYKNIENRFSTALSNYITTTDKNSFNNDNFYKILNTLYSNNIYSMISIEISELLGRELLEHIVTAKIQKIKQKLAGPNRQVKAVRVFKTNKIVDIYNKTDFIISIEYTDDEGNYLDSQAIPLDLKINQAYTYTIADIDTSKINTYNKKIKSDCGTYNFLQSDRFKEIDNTIKLGIQSIQTILQQHEDNQINIDRQSVKIENRIIAIIDTLATTIEMLNDDISYYILEGTPDEMIEFNNTLVTGLENAILDNDISASLPEIVELLNQFTTDLSEHYEQYDISIDLGTSNKRPIPREFHIGKRTMSEFFEIAFESISQYGSFNKDCPVVKQKMKTLMQTKFKDYTEDLLSLLKAS